jgi:hypothetical protein
VGAFQTALGAVVEQAFTGSATEVRKNIYGDDSEEAKSKEWTRAQAWHLTQLLAEKDEVRFRCLGTSKLILYKTGYEDVLYNGPFGGNDKPLHALEQAEMISVVHREGLPFLSAATHADKASGEPSLLKPGKPIWRAAFRRLVDDPVFSAVQQLAINNAAAASAGNDIKAAQEELISLGSLFPSGGKWLFTGSTYVPPEVAARVDSLLAKIRGAQEKQQKLAEESDKLKQVLKL